MNIKFKITAFIWNRICHFC